MDKKQLVRCIIERLAESFQRRVAASHFARAEATNEQSKAENKYDTRGLEASYLARGQSRQAAEIENAIEQFSKLSLRSFQPSDPINLGAYVELKQGRDELSCFIGPCAGGTEVDFQGKEVTVLTPQSPLGQELLGKVEGEKFLRAGSPLRWQISLVR
jgi:transcription elongation GreA/GreB family factor